MSLSDTAAAGVLDQCLRGVAFAAAGSSFAALAANGGAEVSGTGYVRQAVTFGAATTAQPSVVTAAAELNFGTVAGDWTPLAVDEVRLHSALTGGTLLASDTDTQITYVAGNRAFIRAGMTFDFGSNSIWSAAYSATVNEWLWRSGTAPAQARYLGLLNAGTELSGGNYARLDTNTLWAAASVADPSSISFTGGAQQFIASATFTGTVNQLGLYSATTGGSPLITIAVTSQAVANGDEVTVNPTITLT